MKRALFFFSLLLLTFKGFSQLEYYQGYRDGFKEGYCHGEVGCVAPFRVGGALSLGEKIFTYQDGYNNGFAAGVRERNGDSSDNVNIYANEPSNKIISMYNPQAQQKFIDAVVQRQAIFDQNKSRLYNLLNWIEVLKSQSSDRVFLSALDRYYQTLQSLRQQDLSRLTHEISSVEFAVDQELNNAASRASNSSPSISSSQTASNDQLYSPGEFVRVTSGGIFRREPNSQSAQMKVDEGEHIVKVIKKANDDYYLVQLDGRNMFISKAFIRGTANSQQITEGINQDNYQVVIELIEDAFRKGDFLMAREKLTVILNHTNEPGLFHYRGLTYYYERDFIHAIEDFTSALNLDSEIVGSIFWRGLSYFQSGDDQNALIDFSKTVRLDPKILDAFFVRALIKSRLGDKKGAVNDYDQIIKNYNDTISYGFDLGIVYNNAAYCYVELGDFTTALTLVNTALNLTKDHWTIWDTRGEINYKTAKYSECVADMTKAISLEEHDNSFYYRGLAKIMLNMPDGCNDLSKAGELGRMESYDAIKQHCNK